MHELILFLGICSAYVLGSKLPGPAEVPAKDCERIIGCYYTINLPDDGPGPALLMKDIDTSLCTHIYYNFAKIDANASVESGDPYVDIENGGFKDFNDLRTKNPHLKTMATMTGFVDETTKNVNIKLFADAALREKLVNNVVKYVKKYGFNGMDIDYSDLPQRGGNPSDKENFVLILKALRERFDKKGLILSVTVDPNEETAKILYDVKGISRYVNFINLMTFDFHGNSDADKKVGVGHSSPMYYSLKENAEERKRNIDYVVRYWISQGAPPNKLILGTSFNGLSYTLANPKQFGRGAPFTKEGEYGEVMGYFKICNFIKNWKYFYDPEQQVPYIYKGNQIIAYDDVSSIKVKAEYATEMHLGGAMVYSIGDDDFGGNCGEKFALLKTLNRVLKNEC